MEATELRDYFAANVLVGIYSNNEMFINLCNDRRIDARNKNSDTVEEYIAQKCYLMADVMMKERIHDIWKQTEIKRVKPLWVERFKEYPELEEFIKPLKRVKTESQFNKWLNNVYDFCDIFRIWVEL